LRGKTLARFIVAYFRVISGKKTPLPWIFCQKELIFKVKPNPGENEKKREFGLRCVMGRYLYDKK